HGISYANARRAVRLARQLRDDIPCFGAALRDGRISPDQVEALASTALTSPTRIAALAEPITTDTPETEDDGESGDDGAQEDESAAAGETGDDEAGAQEAASGDGEQTVEDYLLAQAQEMRPEKVRRMGLYFAQVADPDADER